MKDKASKSNTQTFEDAQATAKKADKVERVAKQQVHVAKAALKAAKKELKAAEKAAKRARKEARRARKSVKAVLASKIAREKVERPSKGSSVTSSVRASSKRRRPVRKRPSSVSASPESTKSPIAAGANPAPASGPRPQ